MLKIAKKIIKHKIQIIFLLLLAFLINIIIYYIPIPVEIEENILSTTTVATTTRTTTTTKLNENIFETEPQNIEELKIYSNILNCLNYYNNSILNETDRNNYNIEAHHSLHKLHISRGIVIFYPANKNDYFEQEFRWVYRSWIG
jgi:hypothetical protein